MMLWDGLVVRDAGRVAGGRYGDGGQGQVARAVPSQGRVGDTVAMGNQSPRPDGPGCGPARVRR